MDNKAKKETSRGGYDHKQGGYARYLPDRGGKNGALGTVQNKQEPPWVDGGHSRLLCELHQSQRCPPRGFTKFGFNTWMSLAEEHKNAAPTKEAKKETQGDRS